MKSATCGGPVVNLIVAFFCGWNYKLKAEEKWQSNAPTEGNSKFSIAKNEWNPVDLNHLYAFAHKAVVNFKCAQTFLDKNVAFVFAHASKKGKAQPLPVQLQVWCGWKGQLDFSWLFCEAFSFSRKTEAANVVSEGSSHRPSWKGCHLTTNILFQIRDLSLSLFLGSLRERIKNWNTHASVRVDFQFKVVAFFE